MKTTEFIFDGKQISYEVEEDGYMIYLDNKPWIHQYEPYIPDKSKSYEENALIQIEDICRVDVPEQDRAEVLALLDSDVLQEKNINNIT